MNSRTKGILYMLGSSLSFTLMSASAKFTAEVPLTEKLFVRNSFAVVITLILVMKYGGTIKGNNHRLLLARAVLGFLGALCYFYAINYLSLNDATLLNKVCPFFVIIFSSIFLGEKIHKHNVPVLITGLFGAGLVLKPGFQYNFFAAFMALASAVTAGLSFTIIRHLRKSDSPQVILLYFMGFSVIGTIPLMFFQSPRLLTTAEFLGLLSMGLFTSISQLCINMAYSCAPAGELSVFDYTTILFSAAAGYLMWHEIPDILSLLGGLLIIAAGLANYRMNRPDSRLRTAGHQ